MWPFDEDAERKQLLSAIQNLTTALQGKTPVSINATTAGATYSLSPSLNIPMSFNDLLEMMVAAGSGTGITPERTRDTLTVNAGSSGSYTASVPAGSDLATVYETALTFDVYDQSILLSLTNDGVSFLSDAPATVSLTILGAFLPVVRYETIYNVINNSTQTSTLTIDTQSALIDATIYETKIRPALQAQYGIILDQLPVLQSVQKGLAA